MKCQNLFSGEKKKKKKIKMSSTEIVTRVLSIKANIVSCKTFSWLGL